MSFCARFCYHRVAFRGLTSHSCTRTWSSNSISNTSCVVIYISGKTRILRTSDYYQPRLKSNFTFIPMPLFRRGLMKNWYAVEVRFAMLNHCSFFSKYPPPRQFRCKRSTLSTFGSSLSEYLNISYVIIGGVVVGASWYLGRLARGPDGNTAV